MTLRTSPDRAADQQILVIAKAPVPGRVKTRLCPPYGPVEAAELAAAALADTRDTVRRVPCGRRVIALAGDPIGLDLTGYTVLAQRGDGLGQRLANAFADAMTGPDRDRGTLLIGMDTPQVGVEVLSDALTRLAETGCVLGPARDGGWWALGVSAAEQARVLADVPMSRSDTGRLTGTALGDRGIRWALLPEFQDVDTAADAAEVAALAPDGRFAAAVRRLAPAGSAAR